MAAELPGEYGQRADGRGDGQGVDGYGDGARDAQGEPRRRAALVATLFLAVFLAMLDLSVVNVALPAIGGELGTGIAGLQWVIDSYTLAFAGLLLVGGLIGDRLGQRAAFLWSMTAFVVGAALCTVAPSLPVLLAGRAVQGMAAAVLVPGSLSLIVHSFPDPVARAKVIGAWSGLNGVAVAAGPVLGGWLTSALGWPAVFAVNLPLGLLALVLAARALPRPRPSLRGQPMDVSGPVLGLLWSTALAFALIEGGSLGWASPAVAVAFGIAVAGFVAFLAVERRGEHRMLPVGLFRSSTFSGAIAVAFVVGFALSSVFFFLSLYFQRVKGYSEAATGLAFVPAALAMVIGSPLAGRAVGRAGPRPPMLAGLALAAVGLGLLATLETDTPYGMIWWILVLFGLGVSASIPATNSAALAQVAPERSGAGSATVESAQQFGLVFGIAVLGAVQASGAASELAAQAEALPAPVRARAVEALAHQQIPEGTGAAVARLRDMSALAHSNGLSAAFAAAACAALAGALVAFFAVRAGSRAGPRTGVGAGAGADGT
ncbi:DHA2 family efflux MFS transporter permease subunit [Streptomyces sp. PU-14G]|uniref:DHA2 family efflux MFS transporter permease subunit n=1 Tax=Streptomyces sp. PU-14G TaxID=2800808 RepID=UPI0034DE099C